MSVTDNPKATEQPLDGAGKSQFGGQVSSPSLTQNDVDLAVHKVKSELGRQHGDERRAWQRQQEEAELNLLRDDPDKYNAVKLRQEANRLKAEAEETAESARQTLAEAKLIQASAKAKDLAQQHNVDASLLMGITDGNVDKMEALAKLLPKVGSQPQPLGTPPAPPLYPDSNEVAGGGSLSLESLTKKDIRGMNRQELAEHKSQMEAAVKGLPLK